MRCRFWTWHIAFYLAPDQDDQHVLPVRRVSLAPDLSPKKNRRKSTKIENIKYTEIAHSVKRSPLPEMADCRSQAPRAAAQGAQRPTLRAFQAMEGNKNNTKHFLRQNMDTREKTKI